ncbi:hypothetical protein AB0H29_21050 [Streptomyces thermolilacinus]
MATVLPVPIEFRLPEGWQPAPPDEVGAPGVAFIALHPQPDAGFTANITIDGEFRTDSATLTEIADESVQRLLEVDESLVVVSRRDAGSHSAPALTQTLSLSAVVSGAHRHLVQTHVYLSMLDVKNPGKRAVVRLVLTATAAQHDGVLADFQEFVRSVRPDTGSVPQVPHR